MKKHLLLALALIPGALTANATIDMFMGEQKLDIDGTYTFNTITEDPNTGGFIIDPHLSLLSTEDAMVNITARCTSGQKIQMCAGGQCVTNTTVSKTVELKTDTKLDLRFEYINNEIEDRTQLPKNITTVFTVEDLEVQTYTIVMNSDGSGISAVIDRDREVVYANGELIYNLDRVAKLTLCDTNGHVVLNTSVDGYGSISLANLAKGIYIYRLGHSTGKVVVR
jgi:hypothetical protein